MTDCASAWPDQIHVGSRRRGLQRLLRSTLLAGVAAALWLVVADSAIASVGYLLTKSGASRAITVAYAAGHIVGLTLLIAVWRSARVRRRLTGVLERTLPALGRIGGVLVLVGALTAARIAWVLLVPTEPRSDNQIYHILATKLADEGVYGYERARAFWPPGYPFFLAGLYSLFGPHVLVAKLANVALAAAADVLIWLLVRAHCGARCAALALLLSAAWTWRTLHVDVLSYDDLVVVLTLASITLIPRTAPPTATGPHAKRHATGWMSWIAAGVVLGLACFVRATLGVLPVVVGGWLLLRGWRLRRAVLCTLVYGLAMLLPIIPWTIRNYTVFHTFVPLTTNAGGIFHNSWALGSTGCLHEPAALALEAAAGGGELAYNSLGYSRGLEAIRADPWRAAWVALYKQAHYLGSDNWWQPIESYIAAFGDRTLLGTLVKLGGHTLSNASFVFLLWVPLLVIRRPARLLAQRPLAWLCLTIFLTGMVIHTVFEAQARYHLIYLPFWSIMLALLLEPRLARASHDAVRAKLP